MELVRPAFQESRRRRPRACAGGRTAGAWGDASATFGELIQGREPGDDNDFLVTLPITDKSTARFQPFADSPNLYVLPASKTKSLLAARLFLERYGLPTGGILSVSSGVEEGKGLASSSADLVATLRAMARSFEVEMSADDMLDIIRRIEPTDGVMYEEAVAFFHRRVELRHVIGRLPRLCILAIDEGGTIDTISYNRQRFDFDADEMDKYADLLQGVTQAILERRVKDLGRFATASARLHQKRNFKTSFDKLERIMAEYGADGIVNCHSGTYIGLCFDMSAENALERIQYTMECLQREFGRPVQQFFSK